MSVHSGYQIEKMNTKTGKWEPQPHSVGPDVTEFRVPELKENEDYKFRVRAENDQGLSEPLDSDKATKAKNPFGTYYVVYANSLGGSTDAVARRASFAQITCFVFCVLYQVFLIKVKLSVLLCLYMHRLKRPSPKYFVSSETFNLYSLTDLGPMLIKFFSAVS